MVKNDFSLQKHLDSILKMKKMKGVGVFSYFFPHESWAKIWTFGFFTAEFLAFKTKLNRIYRCLALCPRAAGGVWDPLPPPLGTRSSVSLDPTNIVTTVRFKNVVTDHSTLNLGVLCFGAWGRDLSWIKNQGYNIKNISDGLMMNER